MSHTIQIELQPEMEARLAAEAEAKGLALEHYIVQKLADSPMLAKGRSVAEAVERIRQMRKGNRLDGVTVQELVREGRKY